MPTGPYLGDIDLASVCVGYVPDEVNEQEDYGTTLGNPIVIRTPNKKQQFSLKIGAYTITQGDALKVFLYSASFDFYPKGETDPLTCLKITPGVQEEDIPGGFTKYYMFTIRET